MSQFILTRDINGYVGFGLPFSEMTFQATLATSTNTTLTVPTSLSLGRQGNTTSAQFIAIFSFDPGTSVWVSNNTTANSPAGASFVQTNSQLNPAARTVKAGDILNFYTPGIGVSVNVSFYSLS